MSDLLGGTFIGTPVFSNLPVYTSIVCLGPSPMPLPLATTADVMPISLMGLLTAPREGPAPPLQYLPPKGVCRRFIFKDISRLAHFSIGESLILFGGIYIII